MYPCVYASTEKPSTPHGSRSTHVQIMKLIHHNKNPLSADVSVAAYFLVEYVLPKTIAIHMDYAVITILYLFVLIVVGFCLFQVAGVIDKLVYEKKAPTSDKV